MEGLPFSYFETIQQLRLLVKQRNDIQIFLLLNDNDESLGKFIAMTGPFYVLPAVSALQTYVTLYYRQI